MVYRYRRGVALLALLASLSVQAQTWETAATQPSNPAYFQPDYPVAFVGAKVFEEATGTGVNGKYHIGTDVLSANNPDAGHHLWILLPDGQVKKLFPLPAHEGLIDTPAGQLDLGSVVEPNISEDGTRLYFSYFHDTTLETSNSFSIHRLPTKGADLYALDLAPLLNNLQTDPATLPVNRLTFREYGPGGGQSDADKNKDAMNPTVAGNTGPNGWGTVYMHAVEMRTATGLKLVYVSDERRLRNSNQSMSLGDANHNFNLHIADLLPDGSIGSPRQWQYYTTTSVLSPAPLRSGVAVSYQASTADARHWQLQGIDAEGRWFPLLGYGINPELFHLASFCVKTTGENPGDYLVAARYYNFNNEGFGSLWALDLDHAGTNAYDVSTTWGKLPRQVGAYELAPAVISNDYPSPKQNGQYVGKMTAPRCGRPDELYYAYTPTSANGRLTDDEGNKNIYYSAIAYRPDLEQFNPLDTPQQGSNQGHQIVVDDTSNNYALMWPTPILPWAERLGQTQAEQAHGTTIADPTSPIAPGEPFAQVGTSALYHTDRRPFDCWLGPGQTPFSPNDAYTNINQENDLVINNTAALTRVQNQADFCEPLAPASVMGIAVNLTSNKPNLSAGFNPGYETQGSGPRETATQLGFYDVTQQLDQSFQARIPARVPFEFHLIDRRYGLKLVDVRSWHSLLPRETRTDCGGCHQHESGAAIDFQGTVASQVPALDMTEQTQFIDYDAECTPQVLSEPSPSRAMPEWKTHIWPGFDSYCSSCHQTGSGNQPALNALSYDGESTAYDRLKGRNYADTKIGALGSPAFWAARGERADGRNNNLSKYQPDYAAGNWGYFYSDVHSTDPGLCDGSNPAAASWVYQFGQWIDNHMPRNTGSGYSHQFDRFHPAVDLAISTPQCEGSEVRIGYWDDSGLLDSVEIIRNADTLRALDDVGNGALNLPVRPIVDHDEFEMIAIDPAGNRQVYRASGAGLVAQCLVDLLATDPIFLDGFQ